MDPMSAEIADVQLLGGCLIRPEQVAKPSVGPFVAGPENRLLRAAWQAVCERPGEYYNPLVLYGPSGTGKSHLAGLADIHWSRRFGRRAVRRVNGRAFARELADAIDAQATELFRRRYRRVWALILEELEGVVPNQAAQVELLHTLDVLLAEDRQVLVTARVAPAAIDGLLAAIAARLTGGLVLQVAPAGMEARLAFINHWASSHGLRVSEEAGRLLAEGIAAGSGLGEIEQLLTELKAAAAPGDTLRPELVRRRLARRSTPRPTLRQIAAATARQFGLKVAQLRGRSRSHSVVQARAMAVYMARRWTNQSLKQIGEYFGGRDHSTVLHACRRIEGLLTSDAAVRLALDQISRQLQATQSRPGDEQEDCGKTVENRSGRGRQPLGAQQRSTRRSTPRVTRNKRPP